MKALRPQIFLLLVLLTALPVSVTAEVCHVQSVIDGDSLLVSCDQYEGVLGLIGVDAPEEGQYFAYESTEYLQQIVADQELALLSFDRGTKKGKLLLPGGSNVNATLVREGYAWAVDRKDGPRNYLLSSEKDARKTQLNLWSQENNQPPWEFRRQNNIKDDEAADLDAISLKSGAGDYSYASYEECMKFERNKRSKRYTSGLATVVALKEAQNNAILYCAPLFDKKITITKGKYGKSFGDRPGNSSCTNKSDCNLDEVCVKKDLGNGVCVHKDSKVYY